MSPKTFLRVFVLVLTLLACLAVPGDAQAGGVCGSTYVVQWGDTLERIATICGTTVPALYAANPGISGYLYAGQVLVMPADGCNCPPASYGGAYIVQYGDTFSGIASRYGLCVNQLWAANPQIWNINYLYPGQVIYLPASAAQAVYPPASSWFVVAPTATETMVPLSYGTAPEGTPYGRIKLSNQADSEVYVSLQGTTRDDVRVINEYPVSGKMNVKIPAGWYIYVAWVGGQKYSGQFHLGGDSEHTITFYSNRVVVD
ncbi:MAG: LysM peptidoglycan-binding domain-containing protein [Chloroflexota bacterium]